jgi:hypothetical protein
MHPRVQCELLRAMMLPIVLTSIAFYRWDECWVLEPRGAAILVVC